MTNPRKAPAPTTWTAPNNPFAIDCGLGVLEQIGQEVVEACEQRGGEEIGGLLLGVYDGARIHVHGFEPVQCEHATGPTFRLSANDRKALAEQLRTRPAGQGSTGQRVVGWYHSHTLSPLDLSVDDVILYDEYFPKSWQVALLLRPDGNGNLPACFYFRKAAPGDGRSMARSAPFSIAVNSHGIIADRRPSTEAGRIQSEAPPAPRPEPVEPGSAATPPKPIELPPPVRLRPQPVQTAPQPVEVRPKPARVEFPRQVVALKRNRAVLAVLASLFALAIASVLYLRFNFATGAKTANFLRLEAGYKNGSLQVSWDTAALGNAKAGDLEVRDGTVRGHITLDRPALLSGHFAWQPKSEVTAFRLSVPRADGVPLEGSATVVVQSLANQTKPQTAAEPEAARLSTPPAPERNPPQATSGPVSPPPIVSRPPDSAPPPPVKSEIPAKATPAKANPPTAAPLAAKIVEPPKPAPAKNVEPQQPSNTARTNEATPVQATKNIEQPKPAPPASPALEEQKQPEPPARRTEAPPAQTAQVLRPAIPDRPPAEASRPAPAPPATNQTTPQPSVAAPPKPARAQSPAPAVQLPPLRLAGRWQLQRGGLSRSPSVPESLSLTVADIDSGVRGTLEARYRSGGKTERVNFSFSGKVAGAGGRFAWVSGDGHHGQVELIRVPNSPDQVEVVWYGAGTGQVFDEVLKRVQ
jgi:proteasome lid subunit RPN8/RPN11